MTEQKIDEAFGSITPDYPIWQAIVELLQSAVDSEVEAASRLGLDDAQRHFNAGGLHQALEFRNELLNRMETIQRRNLESTGTTQA